MKVAVVGVGNIGQRHVKAYQDAGVSELIVVDNDATHAEAVASAHGCRWTTNYAELLLHEEVQAVSICTPPAFHREQALRAIQHGLAVLCEKPFALTSSEARDIVESASSANTLLMTSFPHRHYRLTERVRTMIRSGHLGQLINFRVRFAVDFTQDTRPWVFRRELAGGGALMDAASHGIDLFRDVVGEIAQVYAVNRTVRPDINVEDVGVVILEAPDGTLGIVEADWTTPAMEYGWSINGTSGAVQVGYDPPQVRYRFAGDAQWTCEEYPDSYRLERIGRQVAHFLDCLAGRSEPRGTGVDGLRSMEIVEAAYKSTASRCVEQC